MIEFKSKPSWLIAIISLLASLAAYAQTTPDSITGDWYGALETPAGDLPLIITINTDESGVLTGEMESPNQAPGQKIPLSKVTLDQDGLSFSVGAIGASYQGQWDEESQQWQGVFTQGIELPLSLQREAPEPLPVIEGLDGVWSGSVQRNEATLRLILKVRTDETGTRATLDSPDMVAFDMPVTELMRDNQQVSFNVPVAGVSYDAMLSADGENLTGNWTFPGRPEAEVSFERTSDEVIDEPPNRPQTPSEPFPYEVTDVTFDNLKADGVTLAGTLTQPSGDGPFPAAILITGSGPQDRDETIFGHKPFAVLADYLTRQGIAVLRYDDRGIGESTGDFTSSTSADFATDANAAVDFLMQQDKIDKKAIGLIGHSEGGMIAPISAVANDNIAYIVLLAGPGTDLPSLMQAQRRLVLESQGASEEDMNRAEPLVNALIQAVVESRDSDDARQRIEELLTPETLQSLGAPESARERVITTFSSDWFRFFVQHQPAEYLRQINIPVLALNGSLDQQVPAHPNLDAIRAALSHNPDVTIEALEGLNHLFQTAHAGSVGEYADIEETFAPAAMQRIAAWILQRFADSR